MYAIVKVGGKQYRVEKGDTLVVDRMHEDEGAKVTLQPLLFRSDEAVFDSDGLDKVKVEAVVRGHQRGEKIRILKFKPKRGYKRRTGHRSDLTRLEIRDIKLLQRASPAVKEAKEAEETPKAEAKPEPKPKPAAKPKAPAKPRATKPRTTKKETEDGS